MNLKTTKPGQDCRPAGPLLTNNPGQDKHMNTSENSITPARPAMSEEALAPLVGVPLRAEVEIDHPLYECARYDVFGRSAVGRYDVLKYSYWKIERRAA